MTHDDALVEAIKSDYREANIDPATSLMLEFVERTTRAAYDLREEDVLALKEAGFEDDAILDIVHITGYFNHINRVVDALGVELEDFMVQGR
ncbi:MAG: carboxymuconolactone decarboxylase family protein [bacterium]